MIVYLCLFAAFLLYLALGALSIEVLLPLVKGGLIKMEMKATGIIRCVDRLGRVVIPREIRRWHNWKLGTPVEIFTAPDGYVILRKHAMEDETGLLQIKDDLEQAILRTENKKSRALLEQALSGVQEAIKEVSTNASRD